MDNEFLTSLQRLGRIDIDPAQKPESGPEGKPAPAPSAEKKTEEEKSPTSQGEPKEPEGKADEETQNPEEGQDNTDDETKLPFHKHPRWRALQQELKEAREFREAVMPLLERLGQKPEDRREEEEKVPDWFIELFGENEVAWQKYRAYDENQRKKLRAEILHEIQVEQENMVRQQKAQEKWVDDELQKLSDEGFTFERNELLKVALDYLPTDADGNIDFRKAYEILQLKKAGIAPAKPRSEEKKKIADQTVSRGKISEEKKDYQTFQTLRGKTFHDLIPGNN